MSFIPIMFMDTDPITIPDMSFYMFTEILLLLCKGADADQWNYKIVCSEPSC